MTYTNAHKYNKIIKIQFVEKYNFRIKHKVFIHFKRFFPFQNYYSTILFLKK